MNFENALFLTFFCAIGTTLLIAFVIVPNLSNNSNFSGLGLVTGFGSVVLYYKIFTSHYFSKEMQE